MNSLRASTTFLLAASLAFLSIGGADANAPVAIRGTVTSESGFAFSDAEVAISGGGGSVTVSTDENGTFEALIPSGSAYQVTFDWDSALLDPFPSSIGFSLGNVQVDADVEFSVSIPDPEPVRIRTLDKDGTPLQGVKVKSPGGTSYGAGYVSVSNLAEGWTGGVFGMGLRSSKYAISGADGIATLYLFDNPGFYFPYEYLIQDGLSIVGQVQIPVSGPTDIDVPVVWNELVTVTGSVESRTGLIPQEEISLSFSSTADNKNYAVAELTADASGNFSASFPGGTQQIHIVMDSTNLQPIPNIVEMRFADVGISASTTMDVIFDDPKEIAVYVVDQNGDPLENVIFREPNGLSYGSSASAALTVGSSPTPENTYLGVATQGKTSRTDAQGRTSLFLYPLDNTVDVTTVYLHELGFSLSGVGYVNPLRDDSIVITMDVPRTKLVSGTISTQSGQKFPNKPIQVSGPNGYGDLFFTDANGDFSELLPEEVISLSFDWNVSSFPGQPGKIGLTLQNVDISSQGDQLNITLPDPHELTVSIVDASGVPVEDVVVSHGVGSSHGSTGEVGLDGLASGATALFGFSGAGRSAVTDVDGVAKLYAYDFPTEIDYLYRYMTGGGFTFVNAFSQAPTGDAVRTIVFDNLTRIPSQGANEGSVVLLAPEGYSLEEIMATRPDLRDLPQGTIDLTGEIAFKVTGLQVGAEVDLFFLIPPGELPDLVYKRIGNNLVNFGSEVIFDDNLVTMTVVDGGYGDEDGVANGEIVDPVVFLAKAQSVGGGGGGFFPIEETPAATPLTSNPIPVGKKVGALDADGNAIDVTALLAEDKKSLELSFGSAKLNLSSSSAASFSEDGKLAIAPKTPLKISASGYQPDSTITSYLVPTSSFVASAFKIASEETIELGTTTANQDGSFDFEQTIDAPAGSYLLQLSGTDKDGNALTIALETLVTGDQTMKTWAKRLPGNTEAKLYAKNIVGAGKVVFKVNGKELAWVRAVDATDPKLRVITEGPMTGANYLVRTVKLLPNTKNILEVYIDGERTTRVAYSRK